MSTPEGAPEDLFLGGKPLNVREGYDSYAIYDPSTKKRTGRYISKTPAGAAMKAARRLLKTAKKAKKAVAKKGKKGGEPGDGEEEEMRYGGAEAASDSCMTHYDALKDCMKTGGAKTSDLFKKDTKTVKFMLRKTTRGAMTAGKRVFYYFAATLKTYKTPLVVTRGGVRVTINHKIFVESLELPAEVQQMVAERKAKKTAAKKPKAAKKAKKTSEAPAAPKARKAPKAKKPKAAKKPKTPKAKKPRAAKRMTGGSSCNMYY